jgi:hypothetical protein
MRTANLKNLFAAWILSLIIVITASGDIIVVNPGESIQAAIDDANNGDEIKVAPGTYNEAINFNGKAVRLYSSGGPEVTTIDANRAFHVVQCVSGEDANTILEGFTITGGNANSPDPNDKCGGGMYNSGSSPTVSNCTFTNNTAKYHGGGMYNNASSPNVTNCIFRSNIAGSGGGMFNFTYSNPTVTNCTFTGNVSTEGGGMFNHNYSNPTMTGCTFSGNSASRGGGMHNNASSPTVTDCNFSDNSSYIGGGGILNCNNSSPKVTNCTFTRNLGNYGGGMGNVSSSPTVTNCNFSNNTADILGGGMFNQDSSSPTVTNCTFSGNSSVYNGGGMCNVSSSPTVTNCTFSGNTANYNYGGGTYNFSNSNTTITNCILWGDWPDEIFDELDSSSTVIYSDVQGGWPGEGNIDVDPCFVDAAAGNLRPAYDSPCIDAADSTALTGLQVISDLDGKDRYFDVSSVTDTGYGPLEFLDMGAYEFNCNYTAGDVNCDGVVDFKDVAILCNNWLAGTEPE